MFLVDAKQDTEPAESDKDKGHKKEVASLVAGLVFVILLWLVTLFAALYHIPRPDSASVSAHACAC